MSARAFAWLRGNRACLISSPVRRARAPRSSKKSLTRVSLLANSEHSAGDETASASDRRPKQQAEQA